jgi:hypothetical protein
MKCQICKKESSINGLSCHLTKKHKFDSKVYYDTYLKKENEGTCYFCGKPAIFFGLKKGYHKICDSKKCLGKTRATGTYEFLMYKYDLSKEDAIRLMNERALDRGEKIKNGLWKSFEKNENFFKEKSRQSIQYWLKKGYNEEESKIKSEEIQKEIVSKTFKKRHDNKHMYLDVNPTQLAYWMKKGYNEEEGRKKISERQKTFTLEKCIEKYGIESGSTIFNERQKKWSNKIEIKYKNGDFVKFKKDMTSNPENELINSIFEKMDIKEKSHFGKNQYYRTFKDLGKTFSYDFVFEKKVIEFNGDYWHCNPKFYNKNYFHRYLQKTAEQIWEENKIKNDIITKEGYDVLIIWESDYNENKEKTIQECVDFLNKK